MTNKEKIQKRLKNDFIVLFVLYIIILILGINMGEPSLQGALNILASLLIPIILLLGAIFAKNGKKSAGVIGIIVGIIYILTLDIISLPLGIFILIRSIKYINNYNKL